MQKTSEIWKFFFKTSDIVETDMNAGQALLQEREPQVAEGSPDQPLDRAFAVLNGVADAARPVSVTEIAADCGLPVPTVHRLVGQLERRGLLARALGSKRVVVGPALVRLGTASLEAALRVDRPHQVLVALAERLGEHCQIGRRVDNAIVYLDSARAPRSDGLYFEHGGRAPLHCTSIGKLFLADMSDADLDAWLTHHTLDRMTNTTLVAAGPLKALVKRVRRENWAVSNQEFIVGVVGCAVPIRHGDGRLIAGLGISAPSARVPFDQLGSFRRLMEASATEIALSLAGDE